MKRREVEDKSLGLTDSTTTKLQVAQQNENTLPGFVSQGN